MIGPRILLMKVSVATGCMTSSYFHTMLSEVTLIAGHQQDTPKGGSSPDATQQLGAEEGHRGNGGSWHRIRTCKNLTGFDICQQDLQPGLQHQVEGRFGGAADAFKAALHDYFLETRLACLRAERKANLLRERSRRADSRRRGIKQCADRVEVVFEPVVGEWLDNHPGAIWRQRLADVMRGAGRVAHVVKTIEEADPIKSLGREILRRTGLERDPLADAGFASGFARRFYRVHMIVVAEEFRIGEGLRHQNGGRAMAAPDVRNAATLLQLRHDTIQRRQPFVDKMMVIGGAKD